MAGKGDKPRDYNRADVKPHSKEWDANYETIFKKEDSILKTYEIWVRVPSVLAIVDAPNVKKARELALEVVQENIGTVLKTWPENNDIGTVTVVS